MELSRRQFVELLAGAGVSAVASSWLVDRVAALDAEGELPVTLGPGIESWVPTACDLCSGGCGLELRCIDGLPVGVRGLAEHPVNRGRLCALPHGAIQMLFSPDRIHRPLKRSGRRGGGGWTEIDWDEAETLIVGHLRNLIGAGFRHRVAFLDGRRPGLGRDVAAGFMRGVGSPHHVAPAGVRADQLARRMFGWDRAPGADLDNSRIVLLFRFDHLETDGSPVWQSHVYARGRERTVGRPIYISVGPRLFGSAAKSERWLPTRPGTEGIVAMAMAHVILENGWEDRRFLQSRTDWPDDSSSADDGLARLVSAITPAVASEVAGLPAASIEATARNFVEAQPGVALVGPGTRATPTGLLTIMAVNLLNLLVGAFDRRGTLTRLGEPMLADVWELTDRGRADAVEDEAIGTCEQLVEALLEREPAPVDLLFLRDTDPVFDSPLGRAVKRGLISDDRTVVAFATEHNDTTMFADLVLPEPTFLERWDVLTRTETVPPGYASLQQPAMAPLFSSRQSEETLARINNALGEESYVKFPETGAESLARRASRGLFTDPRGGLTRPSAPLDPTSAPTDLDGFWSAFRTGIVWSFQDRQNVPAPAPQRITTSLARLLGRAEEPSPHRLRDLAPPLSVGAAERYPFELVVFRVQQLRDGSAANVPMMKEQAGHWAGTIGKTWAEMHTRTAAQAGVQHGDDVRVVSELGHIDATARVSAATPPGTVAVPIGFGRTVGSVAAGIGANVNLIVAPGDLDPSAELRDRVTRVNVVRI